MKTFFLVVLLIEFIVFRWCVLCFGFGKFAVPCFTVGDATSATVALFSTHSNYTRKASPRSDAERTGGGVLDRCGGDKKKRSIRPYRLGVSLVPDGLDLV